MAACLCSRPGELKKSDIYSKLIQLLASDIRLVHCEDVRGRRVHADDMTIQSHRNDTGSQGKQDALHFALLNRELADTLSLILSLSLIHI